MKEEAERILQIFPEKRNKPCGKKSTIKNCAAIRTFYPDPRTSKPSLAEASPQPLQHVAGQFVRLKMVIK